jgi:sporadic carbohydrate cluster 2OG-Fe(II) oxygenase
LRHADAIRIDGALRILFRPLRVNLLRDEERKLAAEFLSTGYVIADAEDRDALDRIQSAATHAAAAFLGLPPPADPGAFCDGVGERITPERLNDLRLAVINALVGEPWFRAAYFACARSLIESLVGNELAMQRGIGFSIQLPNDEKSLLPLHSDAWSEDSPFEVVLWIPLVDVFRTKSMFVLPKEREERWRALMPQYADRGVAALFGDMEQDLRWLDIPYGKVLVFTHTLMHGNHVNRESTARWSMNVRFKGLFTPYSDKRLGEFFEPITIRPASRIGMTYEQPTGFSE